MNPLLRAARNYLRHHDALDDFESAVLAFDAYKKAIENRFEEISK